MEWNNKKYLSFIEDYRKCRVLWDIRNPNYKNNEVKRQILIGLAQKYGIDERSLRKKIKNLRSAFHREHHRLANKIKGEDHEGDDVRKWFAYDALKFILDVTGPYIAKREEPSFSADDSYHHEDDDQDFNVSTQYIQLPTLIPTERSKSPETINPVSSKEEDEYDLFGRSMTVQLRKMPELLALDLMQKMQHMVFNARKQLSKEKRKKKAKSRVHMASKKMASSPIIPSSPESSQGYKMESPEADTTRACDRAEDFSYEYVTAVDEEHYEDEATSSNVVLKRGKVKRKNSKSIDPLEVKQSRISELRMNE